MAHYSEHKADPASSSMIGGLVDRIESGGIIFYVMSGNGAVPPFLAFEFHSDVTDPDAIAAAQELSRVFCRDSQVRRDMIEEALSLGSAYHETGAARAIWSEGDTKQ